ncbi:MAG TPA: hypothetical protein VHP55_08225 [Usitatibacter sp.]|jgi:hypothetical protein|nr:hypothetical protein [Usitatibacter sp.]
MKTILRTLAAISLAAALPAWAEGIAFLSNLKGEVSVDANARPILLCELAKGQRLTLARDAQASVMFVATGKEYALKGPGVYLVKDTEVAATSGMPPLTRETAWRASSKVLAQTAQTSAASVRMRSIALPRADAGPRLVFPTQGNVATLQPTFRWRAADAKAQGEFVLLVAGQEKPVHVAKAANGAYRVPAKLLPDTDYVWVVSVGGDEIGTGRFRTLPADALAQIEQRRPKDKADFSDRVLFTLLLQEMGATQEAHESWARLAEERADLPELSSFAK